MESVFINFYPHYGSESDSKSESEIEWPEENIADRIKPKRQMFDEIVETDMFTMFTLNCLDITLNIQLEVIHTRNWARQTQKLIK